jgi:hypothetical protein
MPNFEFNPFNNFGSIHDLRCLLNIQNEKV